MHLFIQKLVNMNAEESMQLQPKVTSAKVKKSSFSKHDKKMHNVLIQLQVMYLYHTIILKLLLLP